MATKTAQLDKVQARSTRRKYRRSLEAMTTRYGELSKMGKPALVKAMAAAGSKATFKDKAQAIGVILSSEFGADVFARFDQKVINPVVKEEKAATKKAATKTSKASRKSSAKPAVEDEEIDEVESEDEAEADPWEGEEEEEEEDD